MHEKSHDTATTQVHPGKAAVMAVFHLAALFSPLFLTWEVFAVFLLLFVLTGQFGVGLGWHNNHHHQPRSAAHGHRWFEVDASYLLIRGLEWIGMASNVVRPQRVPGQSTPQRS